MMARLDAAKWGPLQYCLSCITCGSIIPVVEMDRFIKQGRELDWDQRQTVENFLARHPPPDHETKIQEAQFAEIERLKPQD